MLFLSMHFYYNTGHIICSYFYPYTYLQDLALIEALWKQDVDLGVPREVYEDDGMDSTTDTSSKDKDHGKKVRHERKLSNIRVHKDIKQQETIWSIHGRGRSREVLHSTSICFLLSPPINLSNFQ